MDFIMGFPKTFKQHDSTMVVVDKLSKKAHFISIKYTYKTVNIAKVFSSNVFAVRIRLMVIYDFVIMSMILCM